MMDLKKKKLFLLDMDGTIYLGDHLFDGTLDFLRQVKANGGRYLFVTNNSSRSVDAYVQRLVNMGIDFTTKEDFLTSVDATIWYLRAHGKQNAKIYASGTRTFREQLAGAGFSITDHLEDHIDLLVSGFDTELTFQKLEDSCILLGRGVDWVATNPDWVCPTWYGSVPDCGSVCRMLTTATGREPLFLGKPKPAMVELALRRTGFTPEQAVIIGDRLYTDIACGVNAGIDSIFVLSGEGTEADIAQYGIHPTWIFSDIAALYRQLEETL